MYEDTCQKKKRKQISSKGNEVGAQVEKEAMARNKKGNKSKPLEGCLGRPNGMGNKGFLLMNI